MIVIRQCCACHQSQAQLIFPFELRQKRRLHAHLDSGEAMRIVLAHSGALRHGDCLLADDRRVIQVVAAPEAVLTATATDPQLLARAAYHLGNRHAHVQLGVDWLRILVDIHQPQNQPGFGGNRSLYRTRSGALSRLIFNTL